MPSMLHGGKVEAGVLQGDLCASRIATELLLYHILSFSYQLYRLARPRHGRN